MAVTTFNVSWTVPGATIYAVARLVNSPYSVWDGANLVAWVDANIASYDVALTERGGDMWAAAVPATLPVGTYSISYNLQAGGSPAITDTQVGRQVLQWNGAALVPPTTTIVLSPYALTTLDSAKTNMGVTSSDDDEKITFLINSASAEIERTAGRNFLARDYRKRLNGFHQRKLVIPNPPIQKMYRISWGIAPGITLGYTGPNISVSASVYADPESPVNGGLYIQAISSLGVTTNYNYTFAAYPTTALLCAAIAGVSGFSASASQNIPSVWLDPVNLPSLATGPQQITYPNMVWTCPYVVDYPRGIVVFDNRTWNYYWNGGVSTGWPQFDTVMPKGSQGIIVQYRGGYETIPSDLQQLCNDLVKQAYLTSSQDTTMDSEKIGDYSYNRNALSTGMVSSGTVFTSAQMLRARLAAYMDNAALIGGTMP